MLDQILKESEFSSSVVITFQVMAVSRVSARDPDAISTLAKSCQKKLGIHPAGAGHPDGSNVWGILQSANPSKIRCSVRTPIAKEGSYFGLPLTINNICHGLSLNKMCDVGYVMWDLRRSHFRSHISHFFFTTLQSLQKYVYPRTLSDQWRPNGRKQRRGHNLCTRPD